MLRSWVSHSCWKSAVQFLENLTYAYTDPCWDTINSWKSKLLSIITDAVSGLEGFWAANCWRLREYLWEWIFLLWFHTFLGPHLPEKRFGAKQTLYSHTFMTFRKDAQMITQNSSWRLVEKWSTKYIWCLLLVFKLTPGCQSLWCLRDSDSWDSNCHLKLSEHLRSSSLLGERYYHLPVSVAFLLLTVPLLHKIVQVCAEIASSCITIEL